MEMRDRASLQTKQHAEVKEITTATRGACSHPDPYRRCRPDGQAIRRVSELGPRQGRHKAYMAQRGVQRLCAASALLGR